MSTATETARGYTYFDHQADVGIEGFGACLEAAFEEAAAAMFNLSVNIECVESKEEVSVEGRGADTEEVFVEWLNGLLAQADIHGMAFSKFRVLHLTDTHVKGCAMGEVFDRDKHQPRLEVKAATYSMLSVEQIGDRWSAGCVVDV